MLSAKDRLLLCLDFVEVRFNSFTHRSKAIAVQAWTGPEGSRSLRLPDFKTVGTLRW